MITPLPLSQRFKIWLHGIIAAFIGKAEAPEAPPPPREGGSIHIPNVDHYPPFNGNAAEAAAHWRSPHTAIFKQHILTSVRPDGTVPESAEFVTLTGAGKVLARVEWTVCDDFGVPGPASKVGAPCRKCGRISFNSKPCSVCGEVCCHVCGLPFDQAGQIAFLCKSCHKEAEFHRDTWLSPAPQKAQLPQANDSEPKK